MLHVITRLLALLFLCLTACQNNPEPVAPDRGDARTVARITGKVLLPAGSSLLAGKLTVVSSWDTSAVSNATYSVNVFGPFSTLFVANAAGDIFLMRYNYPGQPDYDVTPHSTAVALLMTAPGMQSISSEGRAQTIQRLAKDPIFTRLVSAIEAAVVAGKAVTDPTNTPLLALVRQLFTTAALQHRGVMRPKPIVVKNSFRVVSLRNNRVAHSYVAGLYKDEVKVGQSIIIKGTPMFAASIWDGVQGLFLDDGYSAPDYHELELQGDGVFSIRIRSGAYDVSKPGQADTSPEFREAREVNGSDYVVGSLLEHLPIPSECASEVRKAVFSIPGNTSLLDDAFKATSPEAFNVAMLKFLGNVLDSQTSIVKECGTVDAKTVQSTSKFLKILGKFVRFLSIDGKVALVANANAHFFDLLNSTAAIDTCFQATGKVVQGTCCEDPAQYALLSGGSTKVWRYVASDGQAVGTYCGRWDTKTFTRNRVMTDTYWGGDPQNCTAVRNSIPVQLCGDKLGWAGSDGTVAFPFKILRLTATEFTFRAPANGGLHVFTYRP